VQKLPFTVKELADLAPYASDGHPAVAYTAEKRNTLYHVNAANGHILKTFSSAGSLVNEDRSCRRVNPLESLDDDECEPIGTLTLGRIEYTIGIQDRNTGEQISTIRYFEWGPNNRDQDLKARYNKTMDNKYVYTKHDGTIFGLANNKPQYSHKFMSPVARIYDIVRPQDDVSGDASLVVLPQPIGPNLDYLKELEDDQIESIFVNCTVDGTYSDRAKSSPAPKTVA
jgi:serine/threonine-protein kinase/endoribonuclease IRE1